MLSIVWLLCLGVGGCTIGSSPDVRLGVPYRAQAAGSLDCGPASVLMWRLCHGYSELTQGEIGDWMGTTSCGSSADSIVAAVAHFTAASDAYRDLSGDPESFFARQITSIDLGEPLIALVQGGLHAGVVNGGKWSQLTTGEYRWDYVYFHDPAVVANDYYPAGEWMDFNCRPGSPCDQIVSSSAVAGAPANLSAFGDSVIVLGRDDGSIDRPKDY